MQIVLTLLATLILLVFIVFNSIKTEKVKYKTMLAAFINSFIWAALVFLYDTYIKDSFAEVYIFIFSIVEYLFLLIVIYVILKKINIDDCYQNVFKRAMSETKYSHYYIVDSSDRIKDISDDFLKDLGKEYDDVIGKKIFDVMDETIRFVKLNDKDTTNQEVKSFYKKLLLNETIRFDATFRNCDQELTTICIIEEPVLHRGKYLGRISISERHSEGEILEIEKNVNQKSTELRKLQSRFVATLSVSDEGLFYLNLKNNSIWLNDNLKKMLDLDLNTIDLIDFQSYIYSDDLMKYKEVISDVENKESYKITYRFKIAGEFLWVREKATYVKEDRLLVGKIDLQDEKYFTKTGVEELDKLKSEQDLEIQTQRMINSNRVFEIVIFGLCNMPDINERRGMRFGNMAIGEYIKQIKKNFLGQNEEIYRVCGVDFAIILTEPKKMDILKRSIMVDQNVINLKVEYGGIQEELSAAMGVSRNGVDSNEAKELILYAKKSLKTAKNPNYVKNYCYYREIR